LVILSSLLPLQKYWFVLGVFVVLISIRFGFAYALLANLLVFILTYLRPFIFSDSPGIQDVTSGMLEIHQGMCLLALTAGITGRVVSDLRNADTQLSQQIDELRQTHSELDRFVYSTSHDLSAPLKSIQGLINISRIEKNEGEKSRHLDRIERSVQKLERFIGEIQEYARNSRLEVKAEPLSLSTLVEQVIDNHRHLENFERIKFTIEKTKGDTIVADQMRLLLILNNLISNAIQFHKVEEPNRPQVTIHSELSRSFILVHIEDNGEGIREDIITHIFNMFYRGTPKSTGSGLGLFIAKEAAEKMGGSITVKSVYGAGSVFTLHLPRRST
jgi:signal transduction histidine kinase